MTERELFTEVWKVALAEYTKNRYITEDEETELFEALLKSLQERCEIYERD